MSTLLEEAAFIDTLRRTLGVACEYLAMTSSDDDFLESKIGTALEMEIEGLRFDASAVPGQYVIREGRGPMSVGSVFWVAIQKRQDVRLSAERIIGLNAQWSGRTVLDAFNMSVGERAGLQDQGVVSGVGDWELDGVVLTARSDDRGFAEIISVEDIVRGRSRRTSRGFVLYTDGVIDVIDIWRRLEVVSPEAGAAGWMVSKGLLRNGSTRIRSGRGIIIVAERLGLPSAEADGSMRAIANWGQEERLLCLGLNRNRDPFTPWMPRAICNAVDRMSGLSDDPRFIVRERFWSEVRGMTGAERERTMLAMTCEVQDEKDRRDAI